MPNEKVTASVSASSSTKIRGEIIHRLAGEFSWFALVNLFIAKARIRDWEQGVYHSDKILDEMMKMQSKEEIIKLGIQVDSIENSI